MSLKIAIVHEWFTTFGGSEKVIQQLLNIFPSADLFGLIDVMSIEERQAFGGRKITTSFLQNFPLIKKYYRNYLPFMPLAVEQFDFSGYDIIISNCHAVSKGIITAPEQLHISYIHTPIRYAWDMQNEYLGKRNFLARSLLHYIRLWDISAAIRPDQIIANSNFIARRIQKIYRRQSTVIHPPVDVEFYVPAHQKEDFYITASRMAPYKRIDLIVNTFRELPDKKLIIIGDGPQSKYIQSICPPNVIYLGYQSNEILRDYLQRAKAFIFAAKEDFGISPVEAQACGTPVIAFSQGGALDTVISQGDNPSGVFFETQTVGDLKKAILRFELNRNIFTAQNCRKNSERFSNQRFQEKFKNFVDAAWMDFSGKK